MENIDIPFPAIIQKLPFLTMLVKREHPVKADFRVITFYFRGENLKSLKKVEEERMDEGEDDEDIEEEDEEDEEEAEGQFLVDLEPGGNSSGRCGLHQKQSHQDEMSNAAALQVEN